MAEKFEKRLLNPFFRYMRRLFLLLAVNFIFCVVAAGSAMVLFFPGLISLHTIAYRMVHDEDDHPIKDFFVEIKNQWSFCWRLEILGMSVILIIAAIYYFDYIYKENVAYDLVVWFSFIFISVVLFIVLVIYEELMIYNNYIKNDTFWMMIRKSGLIALKKWKFSILNVIILAAFVIVLYLFPYIIPFISFSLYIYLIEVINRKTFEQIALEELERECLDENLFLPACIARKEHIMPKILVVGSLNMDYTIYCSSFPKNGETISGISRFIQPGGKGANQAAAAAKSLKVDVDFIAGRGDDNDGETIEKILKEVNINTHIVVKDNVPTGNATIVVDNSAENKIIIIGGANMALKPQDINIDLIADTDIVILQNEIPNEVNEFVIKKAKEYDKTVLYNPAPCREINNNILQFVDYLIVNRVELKHYSKQEDLDAGIEKMRELGVKNLLVTLGSEGSILINEKERISVKAEKAKAVDTVAAGDTYVGYFAAAIANNYKLKEAMEIASKASAITVSRKGSIVSIPTGKEVKFK